MGAYQKFVPHLIGFLAALCLIGFIRLELRIGHLEERLLPAKHSLSQTEKPPGSQFIGTWRLLQRVPRRMPEQLVISRNGEQFLVTYPGSAPQGAAYRDSMLVLADDVNLTYIESSGHLTYFEAEYIRQK